ncbi:MAG: hypothetical protein U5L75_00810 [Candidatus Campbellbacteria bacterium]|nr:hypothetical protein [Candidatus Campbellbacteria bacterium]
MNNNRSIIITVGVLLVLVVAVVALLLTRPSSEEVNPPEQNEEEFNSVSGDSENSVIVNDQIPGDVVFYDSLNLTEDGFVVVRNEVDGEPGEVIGSAFVEAGTDMTGNVELDESTSEGDQYYVELYTDTNENGTFEEDEDERVETEGGSAIRVQITTTVDLPEVKG